VAKQKKKKKNRKSYFVLQLQLENFALQIADLLSQRAVLFA
jgi:hypothetical protein